MGLPEEFARDDNAEVFFLLDTEQLFSTKIVIVRHWAFLACHGQHLTFRRIEFDVAIAAPGVKVCQGLLQALAVIYRGDTYRGDANSMRLNVRCCP